MGGSWVQKQRPDGTYDLVPRDDLNAWLAEHYPGKRGAAPSVFKKVERGSWVWRDGQLIAKSAQIIPFRKSRGVQIIRDIEPFRNVAIDRNEIIGGRKQRRDMMRARGVEECGDTPALPKNNGPRYDAKAHQRSVVDSIKRSLYQHGHGD